MKHYDFLATFGALAIIIWYQPSSAQNLPCGSLTPEDPNHPAVLAMPDQFWETHPSWANQPPEVRRLLAKVSKVQRNLRASQSREFVTTVTDVSPVPAIGNKLFKTAGANQLNQLFIDARANFAANNSHNTILTAGDTIRPYREQLSNWPINLLRYFSEVKNQKEMARQANSGEYSPAAICHLRQYAGARYAFPGYSNHQAGLAVDFWTRDSANAPWLKATTSRKFVPGTHQTNTQLWCRSKAFTWLRANASRYGFVQMDIDEPWHWEYRPTLAADPNRARLVARSCR